jgi:hypothetical protein
MQPRLDPMVLPSTLLPHKLSGHSSVEGLLPLEFPTSISVALLDDSNFREGHLNRLGAIEGDSYPVERGFVRVQREERGWGKRLWHALLKKDDDPVFRNVELLHPDLGILQDSLVVGCDGDVERTPLPVTEREPNLPGPEIEVEGRPLRPHERSSNVGNRRLITSTKSNPVGLGERQSDLSRDYRVIAVESVDEGPVSGEAGHRTEGSLASEEGLTKDFVDKDTVISECEEEGNRELLAKREHERAHDGWHANEGPPPPDKRGPIGEW